MKAEARKLKELSKAHGYWSKEVRDFNSSLPYATMMEINNSLDKKAKQ